MALPDKLLIQMHMHMVFVVDGKEISTQPFLRGDMCVDSDLYEQIDETMSDSSCVAHLSVLLHRMTSDFQEWADSGKSPLEFFGCKEDAGKKLAEAFREACKKARGE